MGKQYCSKCERSREGHKQPFGSKCTLPPLDPEALAAVRAERERERQKEAEEGKKKEDQGAKNDTEDELTDEEDNESFKDLDDSAVLEAEMQRLEQERLELEKEEQKKAKEAKEQKNAAEKREKRERVAKLKAQIEQLNRNIQAHEQSIEQLQREEVENGEPPESPPPRAKRPAKPAAGNHRASRASESSPSPAAPGLGLGAGVVAGAGAGAPNIDPTWQAYNRAVAGANQQLPCGLAANVGANHRCCGQAAPPPVVPGNAANIIAGNPLLAAACGTGNPGGAQHGSTGKSTPEQFIIKIKVKDRDVDTVSYYDFIHGAFRMLMLRLNEEQRAVDDMVTYFEALSGFATQYRWTAVLDLHRAITSEVEAGRRAWSDPIDYNFSYRFLNADTLLPSRAGEGGRGHPRRDGARGREARGDRRGSEYGREDGRRRGHMPDRGDSSNTVCNQYNYNSRGCRYGSDCRYEHVCAECKARGAVGDHPAMYCPHKQANQGNGGGNSNK